MATLAFDEPEGMFDIGPHLGNNAVGCFHNAMKLGALCMTPQNRPPLLNAASRSALTYPMSAQTEVSLPCKNLFQTRLWCNLAVDGSKLWVTQLSASMLM